MRFRSEAWILTSLLGSACAFHPPVDLSRGPASNSPPIGPESTPIPRGTVRPSTGPAPASSGHAPAGPEGPTPTQAEPERSGCGNASLLRIPMGGSYDAYDVLKRLQDDGTFSGRVRIPTYRPVSLPNGSTQWIQDYATAVEYDRQVLAPWFDGSSPDVVNSDIYAAVKDSEPYKYAAQFASGTGSVMLYKGQIDIGHRMASLLAVMFAAAKNGDADCVDYINREWVSKVLPDANAQKLMAQIRTKEAAQLVKEGRLEKVFTDVATNRQNLQENLHTLDETIKEKEQLNKSELERIQNELKESYFSLKSELIEIAPCRDFISLRETLVAKTSDPKVFANHLVEDCKARITSQLADSRNDQLRLQGEIKISEERKKTAEEEKKKAEDAGRDAEAERRQKAIEVYEKQITDKKSKLAKATERTQQLADYESYLTKAETGSVSGELKRINDLLTDRQKHTTSEYLKPEMQQVERAKADLRTNATNYLTLGFFGGFGDSSDAAKAFSK